MLNVATLASLEIYGKHIERLATQWPAAWGLSTQNFLDCLIKPDGLIKQSSFSTSSRFRVLN
jgi:hypothetical protein